jgi:hypothetical protein
MCSALTLRSARVRRAVAVAAVVLGGSAGALMAPAASQAGQCSVGEFCLWEHIGRGGGLYHYAGSDSTLWNDSFENVDAGRTVANKASSWWNRGTAAGPAQVRVFADPSFTGAFTCAPQGTSGDLRYDFVKEIQWNDQVESFVWRASC